MISNGSKDVGYLIYFYKSIRISDIKPFSYFYRLKTLDDSSIVMITGFITKIVWRRDSQLKRMAVLLHFEIAAVM